MTSTLSRLIFYNKRITTLNLQTSPATPLAIVVGVFAAVDEDRNVMARLESG